MYTKDKITLLHGDCMELMAKTPDKFYDLSIVDPPYGINAEQGTNRASRRMFKDKIYGWDNSTPNEEYFKELRRVSKNQIIWGGNYFLEYIGNCRCYLIWDKLNPDRCFADCEMAWTSFDEVARIIKIRPQSANQKDFGKIHPTQKSTELYKYCLKNYATQDMHILDTHLGSGSSAIAAHIFGCAFTGIEIDNTYYEEAVKRFNLVTSQQKLF